MEGHVRITAHALQRWHERVQRGANRAQVAEAFRAARLVRPDDVPPEFVSKPGQRFYLHAPTGGYFVVATEAGEPLIVSYLKPGQKRRMTHHQPETGEST